MVSNRRLGGSTGPMMKDHDLNTQLGRRNLPPQQRIAVVKKFEKKIQEQAQKKYEDTVGRPAKSNNRSPNGEQLNMSEKFHTDKELAKLAGVETGTNPSMKN